MFNDKLKKMLTNKENKTEEAEGNSKKKIENLVFFIIILIITIIIINVVLNGNKKTNQSNNNSTSKQLASDNTKQNKTIETSSNSENLKIELENILKKIQGVGEVNVFVNYSQSSETVAMYNENSKASQTEEVDTSGGTRKIEENDMQKEIIYQENNGEKIPITQKVINPKVEGAIITAKGAGSVNVKLNIIQAVEAVTGLAAHKIQVFEMGNGT